MVGTKAKPLEVLASGRLIQVCPGLATTIPELTTKTNIGRSKNGIRSSVRVMSIPTTLLPG